MAAKVESPDLYASEERFPLLREIFGILLGLIALLILLALVSYHNGANWIGQRGASASEFLILVFGNYVAYALPAMLGINAFHVLRRSATPSTSALSRGWLRGIGGVLILVATCALLTLPAFSAIPFDKKRALDMGGIVGNFMVYSSGLNLARQLGIVGAALVFGGFSLIGLVLFTETILRDLLMPFGGLLMRAVAWAAACDVGKYLARFVPTRIFHGVSDAFWAMVASFRAFRPIAALREFMAGIDFSPASRNRGRAFAMPVKQFVPPPPARETELLHEAMQRSRSSVLPRPEPSRAAEQTLRHSMTIDDILKSESPESGMPTPSGDSSLSPHSAFRVPHSEGVALERPAPSPTPNSALRTPHSKRAVAVQPEMNLFPSAYELPSLLLLTDPPATRYVMSEDERLQLGRRIEQTLATFKIDVEVIEVIQGPVITRFALKVAPGVRVNRILALESELAMALKAHHVRILAPIPGQSAVGIEVPNKRANTVMLKELLSTDEFQIHKSSLSFALGKNIAGEPVVCDLAQMPHLLIAGATGSGKSVCLNTIIASFLYRNTPERIKFVMIDPKRVELSIYQAIPHLWTPVVTDCKKAAAALAWCVEQMEERYKLLAEVGVRNIDGYNALAASTEPHKKLMGRNQLKPLPHVVIIIDELADLMMVARNEVEEYIIRLAQMARAVGMHLILATQRPSVNVITGIIKANFPSRIAFQVSSKVDSRTILDINGAEALMGRGDMLYSPGGVKPFRLQGAFVSDAEVERLADYIREQEKARYVKEDFEVKPTPADRAKAHRGLGEDETEADEWDDRPGRSAASTYDPMRPVMADSAGDGNPDPMAIRARAADAPLKPCDYDAMDDNELYQMALRLILESRKGSVSYIQRRMKIGYARAGRLMDMMEENGIVGPYQGSKPRDILVNPADFLAKQ